jgi:hypothetical protein
MYSSRYMAQFVVAGRDEEKLAPAIEQAYPNDSIKVWTGLWLVSDESSTAQEVCTKLDTASGRRGSVIVTSINGYYGFASKNIWEWLAVKGTPKA